MTLTPVPTWSIGLSCSIRIWRRRGTSAVVRMLLDEPEVAIEHAARAMRLSPLDPLTFLMQYSTALAHFHAGRYDDAGSWAEKAKRANANFPPAMRLGAASCALAGNLAKAGELMGHLR